MLAYFVAIVVAITSLSLYVNAFVRPKIHRKDDFLWSGLGLFYALVLWVCAGRITGSVLLGQMAGVAVAIAFVWENIQLRSLITAEAESNSVLEGFSVLSFIAHSLTRLSQLGKKKTVSAGDDQRKTQGMKKETTKTEEKLEAVKSSEEVEEAIEKVEEKIETVEDRLGESEAEKSEDEVEESEISERSEESQPGEISLSSVTSKETQEEKKTEKESSGDVGLENKAKVNLLGRIRNIFRKPPQKPSLNDSLPDSLLDDIDDVEEEIDPETTAVEVEEAIANLDITDANQEESQERSTVADVAVSEEDKAQSMAGVEVETDQPTEAVVEVIEAENEIEEQVEVTVEITEEENQGDAVGEKIELEKQTVDSAVDDSRIEPVMDSVGEEGETPETELSEEAEKIIPPEDTISSLDQLKIKNES